MKKVKPPHISQEDWDSVASPELTAEWFAKARPAREVYPDLVAAYERGDIHMPGKRGKQKKPTKELVSIRLSRKVLRHFRATGANWQTRLDDALQLLIGG